MPGLDTIYHGPWVGRVIDLSPRATGRPPNNTGWFVIKGHDVL